MISPQIIEYKSKKYDEMIALRHKILREPLGLTFSEEDLQKDKDDFLLAVYISRGHHIAACCILTPIDKQNVKLRQMAVDDKLQNMRIGESMLSFAEHIATKKGFKVVTLHARKVAELAFIRNTDIR